MSAEGKSWHRGQNLPFRNCVPISDSFGLIVNKIGFVLVLRSNGDTYPKKEIL